MLRRRLEQNTGSHWAERGSPHKRNEICLVGATAVCLYRSSKKNETLRKARALSRLRSICLRPIIGFTVGAQTLEKVQGEQSAVSLSLSLDSVLVSIILILIRRRVRLCKAFAQALVFSYVLLVRDVVCGAVVSRLIFCRFVAHFSSRIRRTGKCSRVDI